MITIFIIIALPVLNAILITNEVWLSLLLANTAVISTFFVLSREWGLLYELSQTITYERIELIRPDNYELLLILAAS